MQRNSFVLVQKRTLEDNILSRGDLFVASNGDRSVRVDVQSDVQLRVRNGQKHNSLYSQRASIPYQGAAYQGSLKSSTPFEVRGTNAAEERPINGKYQYRRQQIKSWQLVDTCGLFKVR